ncbi:MAG TPA: hypothetical protein VGC13_00615 [Longimicrobium sp.]|jgi:hypothetical protein|uniref:YncE family protein n=1 Tax=Longimicrobium sp. TaxID=2029185 RepID=UPI002ED9FA00
MRLLRTRAALAAALSAAALFAACDNTGNPFQPGPGPGPGPGGPAAADSTRPTAVLVLPDTATDNLAVGDSLFVRARVTDNTALASVTVEGFSVRGSESLGTAVKVTRFDSKTVRLDSLGRAVRDTTVDRFLYATSDTVPETGVFVVVTARDTAGNAAADTFRVNLGGPRVSLQLASSGEPRGGSQITLRVSASEPRDLLTSVVVRGTGAATFERVLTFTPARAQLDSLLVISLPQAALGSLTVTATATSASNQQGASVPLVLSVAAAEADVTLPRTTFLAPIPSRLEQADSFEVQVSGADESGIDSVGVTVFAVRRGTSPADTLRVYRGAGATTGGAVFRFALAELGLDPLQGTNVDLEVTAWSRDLRGNCGAATTMATPQQLPCATGPGGARVTTGAGRLVQLFVARGLTMRRPNPGDVIADLVADSQRVYLSNLSRNRVEVFPIGATAYGTPVRVGSEPWGLALGRTGDTLFVANSGGTNISAIPLTPGTLTEAEDARIFTPNEQLYRVVFDETLTPGRVEVYDYSDRPQFIAQTSLGQLVYSTKPTGAAPDGTVRIFDPRKNNVEIFTGYVRRGVIGTEAIVVNARSAALVIGNPKQLEVCVRRRAGDTVDPPCFRGNTEFVAAMVDSMRALPPVNGVRYDTRVDVFTNIQEVGLSDTTFVAVSGDRTTVAVGEGVRERARVPVFTVAGDSLALSGNIYDLINNADERVIGLGLNYDGSLGAARGTGVYFFTRDLRLQGRAPSGSPAGGIAMHPENRGYPGAPANRRAFVSGLDESGAPYIDIIDTFNFSGNPARRIYLRDPVIGAMAVAPRAPGDPASVRLRLYAITSGGILSVAITDADM